jgi:Flp pilus assembly protein TadG
MVGESLMKKAIHGLPYPVLPHSRRFASKRGQVLIELLISIVFFVMMVAMVTSISVYLFVQHGLVSAAREGARIGSLDPNIGGNNVSAGQQAVRQAVQNFAQQTMGQVIPNGNITVTPPSATAPTGSRSVRVMINYQMTNPIPIGQFLEGMGVENELSTIPVRASATMHYEE